MPVHVESECGVAMPQEFLHDLHMYAHRHQDGCSPMSQIVESAMWETGILEETGQCVRLQYRSARSDVTERVFAPYGVVYHAGLWYTIGYCHLRQEQRLFRLDRIQQVEVTSETFSLPVNFDALETVQRALASVPRVWQIEVWLETTLEEVLRQTRFPKALFEEVDKGVILRVDVEDLPWMARFLAGLGVPLIIHHPPELRTVLHHYALTMASYAERIET
jgi:predicted DNA-binding transcriptional regulator YafY